MKTTLTGIAAILTAAGAALAAYASSGISGIDWASLIPAIVAGVGLILAHDSNAPIKSASTPTVTKS